MSYIINFHQSNKSDWEFDVSATDAIDGTDIDFTGALVTLTVKDQDGCQVLTATIGSGITQPTGLILEVLFTAAQMETLLPGSYQIGSVFQINGQIEQLLVGTVSVYDGIAQI